VSANVILDCDNACGVPGCDIDDALALAYLLGRDDITLVGVTCVFGNTGVDRVFRQTAALLSRARADDTPLVIGAARAGDQVTPAATFLAQTAAENPGTLVILATGPLTNIAAAAAYDPAFFQNVRAIYCMGGYFGVQQIGLRAAGELNLSADAAAAHTVLNSGAPVSLFVTEVCKQLSFGLRDLPLLRGLDRRFIRHVFNWLLLYGTSRGISRFFMWDLLPALLVTHPEAFGSVVAGSDVDPVALQSGRVVMRGTTGTVRAPQTLHDAKELRRDIVAAWRCALPARRVGGQPKKRPTAVVQ
jgi:purine nucleosidase